MELGYFKIIEGRAYITKSCLVENGYKIGTLNNEMSRAKIKKTNFYHTYKKPGSKKIWILYQSIPVKVLNKLDFSVDEFKFIEDMKNSIPNNDSYNSHLDFNLHQVWVNSEYWTQYIPIYKEYFSDPEVIDNYARTHAVITEILILKREKLYELKEIHTAFQKLQKVCFKAASYSYFSTKLNHFIKNGITETIIHNFKIQGREPYRVNKVVSTLIKSFRLDSSGYNKSKILNIVNTHLKRMNCPTVSKSTVDRICDDIEFRNKTDILRLGKKYADDNITPYLSRKVPDYAGGLYQIDSSQINIYYNNKGTPSYLTLCAVIDVHSRKIIGHEIGAVENFQLIKNTIKSAFVNGKIAPDHILVDNHAAYHSYDFKNLKSKLMSCGINIRYAQVKNAKDKAHIERWFGTFQSTYLPDIYGFLGEGIKTKREGGRANDERTKEYRKLKNLHVKEDLIELINDKIKEYNEAIHGVTKDSPYNLFRVSSSESDKTINQYDIALIFGKNTEITVRKSKIIMTVLGIKYSYTILDRKTANKANATKVKVYYDELDLSRVFISTLNDENLGVIYKDVEVNIVPMTNEEGKVYQSHYLRNIRNTKQNLKEVYSELKEGYEELEAIPIMGLDENLNLKLIEARNENLNDIEKGFLSLKAIESISSNAAYDGDLKTLNRKEESTTPFKLKKVE